MNRFGTRAAADDLARALDGSAGSSATPSHDLALATALRSTGTALSAAVAPRPDFRDALRMRLLAVATVQAAAPVEAPRSTPSRALEAAVSWSTGRRAGAVAAGAMASVVAVSGVAVAGSQSLPGDPFYGVKRTAEAVQLRTADGDVEKGTRHLDFAATRLREVRGLTLGRDAVDAGPRLGPSALSGGITLRSSSQPLAAGAALGAPVAERVRETLAEMDAQTRKGSELLTGAYRSSRAPAPLRALSRFTTRQSAGLEQLLPALPPATQSRARISLALLTDVSDQTSELLGIGTCGAGCDPSQAAPSLTSGASGSTPGGTTSSTGDCECSEPAPSPQPGAAPPSPEPDPTTPSGTDGTDGTDSSTSPSPAPPSSPSPSPSPAPLLPTPVPSLPVPVPSLPVPVPSISLSPAPVVESVESVLPSISSSSTSGSDVPEPEPAPAPLPQLAPLPARP